MGKGRAQCKRSEILQDVPVSVTSFSGAQLQAGGIENIRDPSLVLPGFRVSDLRGDKPGNR